MSVETKSARERYIRVAAIDSVIWPGRKNICDSERHEKTMLLRAGKDEQD
jgi:hypothetical protein